MSPRKNKGIKMTKREQMEYCAVRPQSDNSYYMLCCDKCRNNFCCKVVIFTMVLIFSIIDLVSDWLLFRDVTTIKVGLVYGPVENILKHLLMAFSFVGSLTFIFELVNLWFGMFRKCACINVDLLSAIIIWIEDVPQIVINVVIVACREEAASYFQLVKASLIITGAIIRIIATIICYCGRKAYEDLYCAKVNCKSRMRVTYRVFIVLGIIITLFGAVTVFMFTQVERNPDGGLNFKIPHNILEGQYDEVKYFHNVSIYFSHRAFEWDPALTFPEKINLLRLFAINDIRKSSFDRIIKIQLDQASESTKVIIWVGNSDGNFQEPAECFEIARIPRQLYFTKDGCSGYITSTANTLEYMLKFHYVKASVPERVFGDIKYNVKVKKNNTCSDLDFTIKDNIYDHLADIQTAALHYYRARDSVAEMYHVNHINSTTGQFYHTSQLQDINEVWRTGFIYCKCSGSLAPHLDSDISITCP